MPHFTCGMLAGGRDAPVVTECLTTAVTLFRTTAGALDNFVGGMGNAGTLTGWAPVKEIA